MGAHVLFGSPETTLGFQLWVSYTCLFLVAQAEITVLRELRAHGVVYLPWKKNKEMK